MKKHTTGPDEKNQKRFVLGGKALSVSTPCIMGALNVTPDSFSDGGSFNQTDHALRRIEEMIQEGAHIIDVGGESTRPGADPVTGQEELDRVMPVLENAVSAFPETMFSIDTTKYEVAHSALDCGVHMINDVSGLRNEPRLAELATHYQAALVIMHSLGTPKTMQDRPDYKDAPREILQYVLEKAEFAKRRGVGRIIIDPGIGFGKTLQHNIEIIAQLHKFTCKEYPVLIGASRKSMIGQILADEKGPRPVQNRLAGTLALHYHALMQGADILRVHDVREARDSLEVFKALSAVSG